MCEMLYDPASDVFIPWYVAYTEMNRIKENYLDLADKVADIPLAADYCIANAYEYENRMQDVFAYFTGDVRILPKL